MEWCCEICNKTSKDRTFQYYHKYTKRHIYIDENGKEKGLRLYKKWLSERRKEAYKKIKLNMSPEKYKQYTLSRKTNTKEFYINKYGEQTGMIKWTERCKKNSEYVINRNLYNKEYRKKWKYNNSLNSYIDKYGQELGKIKWEDIQQTKGNCVRREYFLEVAQVNYDLADWLLSQRQSTFSLEKCIEKNGQEKGLEIWHDRQIKWQNTLKSKPIEEIERINRDKISPGCNISKAEYEIINYLYQFSPIHQFPLGYKYIYDIKIDNKIIEYNGDYWHCNPNIYDKKYFNKKLKINAETKWKRDQEKIEYAKTKGYSVLVIWEQDYKSNPGKEIQKCIEFINE